ALRRDLRLLQQASYFAQLVEQTTETETPLPGMFELMMGTLSFLSRTPPGPLTVLAFEVKLLTLLGLQPDPAQTRLDAGMRSVLGQLTQGDWEALGVIRLSAAQETGLGQFLHGFLIYHLGRLPPGRASALG